MFRGALNEAVSATAQKTESGLKFHRADGLSIVSEVNWTYRAQPSRIGGAMAGGGGGGGGGARFAGPLHRN